ncbi:hypothetical protein [Delftia lacustris]|uniref:hypothetical protein n=1 Tax=Delftia lacustris TaxID=558537 RepID=UPI003B96F7F9
MQGARVGRVKRRRRLVAHPAQAPQAGLGGLLHGVKHTAHLLGHMGCQAAQRRPEAMAQPGGRAVMGVGKIDQKLHKTAVNALLYLHQQLRYR